MNVRQKPAKVLLLLLLLCLFSVAVIGQTALKDTCHYIGSEWKNGTNGKTQNFKKACEYFKMGADNKFVMSSYDYGFMLYKGLGCTQDYEKALEMFLIGARYDHTPSLYMAGLCYRNGYGTDKDEERGMKLLRRASLLGYNDAEEESKRTLPENCLYEDSQTAIPETDTSVNDVNLLNGSYQGFLIQYDWSRQYVTAEIPISMTINTVGGSTSGEIHIDGDTVNFRAAISQDGVLSFKESALTLEERYTGPYGVHYRMDYAKLNIWQDKVYGELNLYSMRLHEPERPMYIELTHNGSIGTIAKTNNQITISPNPFVSQFKAEFTLTQEARNVQARFFNHSGVLLETKELGTFAAGKHSIEISPSLPDGYYVLNIQANNTFLRTIVVKKG